MTSKQELRDHFAGLALQGILANNSTRGFKDASEESYYYADFMLTERENHKHEWEDSDWEYEMNIDSAVKCGKAVEHTCTLCGKVELYEI